MSLPLALAASVAVLLLAGFLIVPRRLLSRAQDRLAEERMGDANIRLLTRAELVSGHYRRLPGIVALTGDRLRFDGLFGETLDLATSRIGKIETGSRLASGRRLLRLEVLRITPVAGDPIELVLTPAASFAWRSHFGVWAVKERQLDADRVSPGRGSS